MAPLYFGDMVPPPPEQERRILVGTAGPVALDVQAIEHHLTPDGFVCIGTSHEGRPIGRCVLPSQNAREFFALDLFESPVPVALNVREGGPGVEATLLALVSLDPNALPGQSEEDESAEPWLSSVPGGGYEPEESGEVWRDNEASAQQLVGVFLGEVVRFADDRRAPGSLLREAADMLATVLQGDVVNVTDRLLQELTAGM